MKIFKYITTACIGFLILLNTSCSLDEKWYSEVTTENYYTSQESVIGALGRPFTHWTWYTQEARSFYLQEYTADMICLPTRGSDWYNGGQHQRQHYHTWSADDSNIWEAWRGYGMGLAYAMEIGDDLSKVDYNQLGFAKGVKEEHQMQLKALSAYFYLRALDYFGGVPIYYTMAEKDVKPRSTDKETFDHIETLLLEAIPQLIMKEKGSEEKRSKEDGFIKRGTAAALLAQLYFNAESYIGTPMYDKAAIVCQDLIDGKYGYYDLSPTWYGPHTFENSTNPELIWCTPSDPKKQEYNWWHKHFGHYETYKYLGLEAGGDNGACLSPSLKPNGTPYTEFKLGRPFAKFHKDDLRKRPYVYYGSRKYEGMFLMGVQKNPLTGTETRGNREYKDKLIEFVDIIARVSKVGTEGYPSSINDLPSNISLAEENSGIRPMKAPQPNMADIAFRYEPDNPIIRLAEIYYMLAECKMRAGDKAGAATLINEVRKRNFEGGNDPNPVTAANLDDYRMLDEWFIEFLQEGAGRRRTDLIRFNKFVTEDWWDHKATKDKNKNRFPIPTEAFSGNNLLVQNPGY